MSTNALRQLFRPRATPRTIALVSRARLHTTRPALVKDALMDKDAIDVTSNEYAKTGEGDQSVAHEDAAFDPKNTSPEGQEQAGADKPRREKQNPLNVSPGNKDVSSRGQGATQQTEGSPNETGSGPGQRKSSGGGQGQKNGT